jgi:hypothetical protein
MNRKTPTEIRRENTTARTRSANNCKNNISRTNTAGSDYSKYDDNATMRKKFYF